MLLHKRQCKFENYALRGRKSSVGIPNCYGLDDPGIQSLWKARFSAPFRLALGSTQSPVQEYRVSFPGVKRPVRSAEHKPPYRTEVKERVAYTSTPRLSFHGLFQGELFLCLFLFCKD
jgi:hypothetical protein